MILRIIISILVITILLYMLIHLISLKNTVNDKLIVQSIQNNSKGTDEMFVNDIRLNSNTQQTKILEIPFVNYCGYSTRMFMQKGF